MAGWKLRKDKTQTETPQPENGTETPPPATEFAAPPRESEAISAPAMEDEVELLPLPASRWDLPAEDWSITPPVLPHEDNGVEDEEPAPARVFDLIDTGLSPAEAEAALAEEQFDDEPLEAEDLPFEDDEPATEPIAEPLPTFTEAAAMPERAPDPPVFTPTEPAPEAVASAPPVQQEDAAAVSSPVTFTEPTPEPPLPVVETSAPAPPPVPETPLFVPPPATSASITSTLRMDRTELGAIPTVPPVAASIPTVAPFILDVPTAATPGSETERRLIVRFGRLSATFSLTKDVTVIGRPDSALHYYPDIEIELDDAVSRRHAEVLRRGDDYFVADAGSTNGTRLNGELLPPHEERLLAHGDRIRIGERSEIIFE